jgi:hypothetical protein
VPMPGVEQGNAAFDGRPRDATIWFVIALSPFGVREQSSAPRSRDLLDSVSRPDKLCFPIPFPSFFLYYPQRRHACTALRALVDDLRRRHRR